MLTNLRFRLGIALVVTAFLGPCFLRAQQGAPSRPKIRAVDVKTFAKLTCELVETAELIDELTEAKSQTQVVRSGKAEPESASLVMTYRISDIELTKSITNRIWWFGDVPGRTVTTSIRVDCLVHEWYTVPKRIRGADGHALWIKLSPARHQVEFAGDAFVRDELGSLRSEFLGDDLKAKKLREELYADAQDLAMSRFRERGISDADEVADALKAEVQAAYPDKPVRVGRDESGIRIEIEQFFPTGPNAISQRSESSTISVKHVLAAVVLVVIMALVIVSMRRKSHP